MCRCSHRPFANGNGLSRSEENAIHFPSGDHAGRKSPPLPEVRGWTAFVLKSRIHKFAVPAARVETKTICLPSGAKAAWSSYDGSLVTRSTLLPSACMRYRSADPSRSDVNAIHFPSADHVGL